NSMDKVTGMAIFGQFLTASGKREEEERQARAAWAEVLSQGEAVEGDEARQAYGAHFRSLAVRLIRAQLALNQSEAAVLTLEQSRAQSLRRLLADRKLQQDAAADQRWVAYQEAVAVRARAEGEATRADAAEAAARKALALAQDAERKTPPERLVRLKADLA